MSPTFPLVPRGGASPFAAPSTELETGDPWPTPEVEAQLTDEEWEYLSGPDADTEARDDEVPRSQAEGSRDGQEDTEEWWTPREADTDREAQDADVLDIAERVAAPSRQMEGEARRKRRWTPCFSAADVAPVRQAYEENVDAAAATSFDRCSCIVMLNVGVGHLLGLLLKDHPARGYKPETMSRRPRTVRMADLTTASIERSMAQLVRSGHATGPLVIDFTDKRGRRAGTLAPERLSRSVLAAVTARSPDEDCWYAFGMSLMDGYHSVMLLVDHTGTTPRVYWMDQFSRGLSREVTTTLDDEITAYTQRAWQSVLEDKKKRFDTPVRLWQLRKREP